MSIAISTLGGVGLFLLGMTVMTEGLKALAGSALRAVLGKAASTPLLGSFWGAIVTLLVQSSSATTMTTIGLVSAGLLTFQQGLSLVFGANIGTTGTGWLVALIGVRVSLTAAALPMIFVGALTRLLGRGRISGAGAALAGFGLVLFGLTTLQQGMGGLAERLHPADLPAVLGSPGTSWWSGLLGVLALVVTGLVMTALMQSSTAAIAVTLSGYFAGAIGLDQACALIIGQNIGTATSSALAAIGASATAKRLAIAYVLFKLIAALIALVAFPVVTPLLLRASDTIDGVTLLAGYHTAFNVLGVAVLLPLINPFTRLVERILPERGSPLTRCLDPSALQTPIVAVEAVRRTIARVLMTVCGWVEAQLAARAGPIRLGRDAVSVQEAADAVRQAQIFLSDVAGPPETDDEQRRLTSTLHALDHATRLTDLANGGNISGAIAGGPEDIRAAELCAEVMLTAAAIARGVAAPPRVDGSTHAPHTGDMLAGPRADPPDEAIAELERCTAQLRDMLRAHRSATLGAVANGTLTADAALLRVEAVRNLEALSQHAWRSAIHLIGRG
ncbi:Na/Pi cotransporter family protein [Bradyrhizobium sp. KB893862 SZCCT0404]|uniref:Na/Pi cotransporter family protein n=1 Tax=Bradyrhizobium sp. KB893862 SZCCT0404 TaxID=2807672 RepID=UPI001BA9DF64|nr:Na/Pi symporter [Bradyrhizobium sp. KB893862 SZCCT0404]MBR1174121.1 Na/Pi cotransporter family protein [Bradyrhizobium sp. KB893862 SZCCT0404]